MEVSDGIVTLDLELPDLERAEYAVEVQGAPTLLPVQVLVDAPVGLARGQLMVEADKTGRAVVDGLPAGNYVLLAGTHTRKFRLPGTSAIDLR